MSREKKNKLSIYLIKKDVPVDGIIVLDSSLIIREINGARLYIRPSATKRPGWITSFFGSVLTEEKGIFSSVPSAALIVPVKVEEKAIRYFAITFGAGYHLMQKGVFEEHFGLHLVLNAVDEKNIRIIIYSNKSFIDLNASSIFSLQPLWIASYLNNPEISLPLIPFGWSEWKIWQFTEQGQINGYVGDISLNIMKKGYFNIF